MIVALRDGKDITVLMILFKNDVLGSMPYDSLALDPRRISMSERPETLSPRS